MTVLYLSQLVFLRPI